MESKLTHGSLLRDAIFLLGSAARFIKRDFDRRSRSYGMNRAQWQVLANLVRAEGEKQVTLAEKLDMAPIVLARIVDRLEEMGYVERRPDPDDRRARLLYLTDKSEPLIQQMRIVACETGDLAFSGFSDSEIDQLMAMLGRLCSNLSETFEIAAAVEPPRHKEGH